MADSAVNLHQVYANQQSSQEIGDGYGYQQPILIESPQYRGDHIQVVNFEQQMSAEQALENNR